GNLIATGGGPGSQTLLLHEKQGVFIYDFQTDSVSALDTVGTSSNTDLSNFQGDCITYHGHRIGAFQTAANTIQATRWSHDHDVRSETNGVHYSPARDFGFQSI